VCNNDREKGKQGEYALAAADLPLKREFYRHATKTRPSNTLGTR